MALGTEPVSIPTERERELEATAETLLSVAVQLAAWLEAERRELENERRENDRLRRRLEER